MTNLSTRPLGRSNLVVPEICLGTMTFGEQTSEAGAHAQLDYALAQGVNFIDTAEMYAVPPRAETYGSTETIVGKPPISCIEKCNQYKPVHNHANTNTNICRTGLSSGRATAISAQARLSTKICKLPEGHAAKV